MIPMVNANNNPSQINKDIRIYEIWPSAKSEMTEYDDDGITEAYRVGAFATTHVSSELNAKGMLKVTIDKTNGTYDGMTMQQATEIRVPATVMPKSVTGYINGKKIKLTQVQSLEDYTGKEAVWFFNENVNRLAQWGVEGAEGMGQVWVMLPKVDKTKTTVALEVKGYEFAPNASVPAMLAVTEPSAPQMTLAENDVMPYTITLRWAPMADASEIQVLHKGMLYTNFGTIEGENTAFFEDLKPETAYSFKVRAVNPAGESEWVDVELTTAANPLEFAIKGITATATIASQPGAGLWRAFDHDEKGDIWHSIYQGSTVPFDITMDLGSFNTLDRFEYLPRIDAGNGTILEGTWQISENGIDWSEPQAFTWARNNEAKVIKFSETTPMRYIRLHVDKALGNFGSAREFFVFKVPGSPSYIPGDINKDGLIDSNDLTSYMNYTGLRRGDGDFEYVSMGDVNRNGLLDAFDISVVATKLDGGIEYPAVEIGGTLDVAADKKTYNVGDEVVLTVTGRELVNLNAFSIAIPYNPAEYEYVGIEAEAAAGMNNMTYDRLHTDGEKVLYPTFVNIGQQSTVNGTQILAKIRFKAKKRGAFAPKAEKEVLVSPALQVK